MYNLINVQIYLNCSYCILILLNYNDLAKSQMHHHQMAAHIHSICIIILLSGNWIHNSSSLHLLVELKMEYYFDLHPSMHINELLSTIFNHWECVNPRSECYQIVLLFKPYQVRIRLSQQLSWACFGHYVQVSHSTHRKAVNPRGILF